MSHFCKEETCKELDPFEKRSHLNTHTRKVHQTKVQLAGGGIIYRGADNTWQCPTPHAIPHLSPTVSALHTHWTICSTVLNPPPPAANNDPHSSLVPTLVSSNIARSTSDGEARRDAEYLDMEDEEGQGGLDERQSGGRETSVEGGSEGRDVGEDQGRLNEQQSGRKTLDEGGMEGRQGDQMAREMQEGRRDQDGQHVFLVSTPIICCVQEAKLRHGTFAVLACEVAGSRYSELGEDGQRGLQLQSGFVVGAYRKEASSPLATTSILEPLTIYVHTTIGLIISSDRDPFGCGIPLPSLVEHLRTYHPSLDPPQRTHVERHVKAFLTAVPSLEATEPFCHLADRSKGAAFLLGSPGRVFQRVDGLAVRKGVGCGDCPSAFSTRDSASSHRRRHHSGSTSPLEPTDFQQLFPGQHHPRFAIAPPPPSFASSRHLVPPSTTATPNLIQAAITAHAALLSATQPSLSRQHDVGPYQQPVYERPLGFGTFTQPYDALHLRSSVSPAFTYLANDKTPRCQRDPYRNVAGHVFNVLSDRSLEHHPLAYHLSRKIGMQDGSGLILGGEDFAVEEGKGGGLLRSYRRYHQESTERRYATLAACLVLFLLRITPEIFCEPSPIAPGSKAPPPVASPALSSSPSRPSFTTSLFFPSLASTPSITAAVNDLRAIIFQDVEDQPNGIGTWAAGVSTSSKVRNAILSTLIATFSTRYGRTPAVGQHPFHQFLIFNSLAKDGGFIDIRSYGPQLAGIEFAIRASVMDSILLQTKDGPAVELVKGTEGEYNSEEGLSHDLLDLVTAHPNNHQILPFGIIRTIRYAVSAAIKALGPAVAIEPVFDSPDHILPVLAYGKFISVNAIRDAIAFTLGTLRQNIGTLTFGIHLGLIGVSFNGVQMGGKASAQGGSIFSDPRNLSKLGIDTSCHTLLAASLSRPHLPSLWRSEIPYNHSPAALLIQPAARQYLQLLADTKLLLLSVIHLSSPGARASELITQQLVHTPNHQSSLVVTSGRLAIRTEINKTGAKTIFRFISPSIAPSVVVLFALVQPFALVLLNFLHQLNPTQDDHRHAFQTHLWTTSSGARIGAEDIRRAIAASFTRSHTISGISVQGLRQAEVYFSRQLAPLLDSKVSGHHLGLQILAQQRGHSQRTDELAYGNVDSSGAAHELGAGGDAGASMSVVSLYQMLVGVKPVVQNQQLREKLALTLKVMSGPKSSKRTAPSRSPSPSPSPKRARFDPVLTEDALSFEPDDESGAKRCDKNKPGEGESDGLLSPAARDITASDSLAPAGDYNFHLLTSGIDFNDDFAQDARLDKDDKQAKASNPLASLTPSLPPPPPPPPPPSSIRRTTVPLSSSALYFASPQTPCPATPVKLPPRSSPCQDPTPAAVMTALLRTWTGDPTSELYPGQLEVGIDVIRGGKDILLSSSFSSGKTFLSVLPALLDLVCQQNQLLLYLTPFRSIYANLGPRCRKSGIKVHTYPFPPETQVSELSGILLISVEQLLHSTLRESLYSLGQANKISRIVLDEGHTPATQQSFRPSLSHLGLARLAPRPITVVSGTLTPAVRGYIASLFHTDLQHMSQHNLPLRRANIQFKELYSTAWPGSHSQETKRIIEVLKEEAPDFASNPRRSVIIFVGLRTVGEDLKRVLAKMHKDINVKFLSSPQGDEVEKEAMDQISQAWEQGKINVLIATTAGTHALDCATATLGIYSSGIYPPAVSDLFQASGRVGRSGQDAKFIILKNKYERNSPSLNPLDPPYHAPFKSCIPQHLEEIFGDDTSVPCGVCTRCRQKKQALSDPLPRIRSVVAPVLSPITRGLIQHILPPRPTHPSITSSYTCSVKHHTRADMHEEAIRSMISAVESQCPSCILKTPEQHLSPNSNRVVHQGLSCPNKGDRGCLYCPAQRHHESSCPIKNLSRSRFSECCFGCLFPLSVHSLAHQGEMGGACPFKIAHIVLPLCMDIWRSDQLRPMAVAAGVIKGVAHQEEMKGWKRGSGGRVWDSDAGGDLKFSVWLGHISHTHPFTNATVLFLWYYQHLA